ncbi:MAG: hypothetical protein NWF05_11860 [Candidatus Bathyarchaeota archaeon]|nr:hypothetical protein [Candidatus Bathyarchaeota archaeon]
MKNETGDLYIRFGVVVKTQIKQLAKSLGISQADYVRYTIKQDLKKRGLLKETAVIEQSSSCTPIGKCTA